MVHREGIIDQVHFFQSKQFTETYVTSHALQRISDLTIYPSAGHRMRCGGPHAARGL